jgi:hypothetical protein
VESAFSLVRRGNVGTWHKADAKHLPACLDEMYFWFNNRKNPYLFRDTIIKLIQTPGLEFKELTAQQAEPAARRDYGLEGFRIGILSSGLTILLIRSKYCKTESLDIISFGKKSLPSPLGI